MAAAITNMAQRLAITNTASSVDGPRPGRRQGQRQRVESEVKWIVLVVVAVRRGFQFLLAALAEELPTGHGDDEAAGDAKDRYRNAVQTEDQRAEQQRADEDEERVSRNAPSDETADLVGRAACQAEEDKGRPRLTIGKIAASARRKMWSAESMAGSSQRSLRDHRRMSR
jgi:hypothetical protein